MVNRGLVIGPANLLSHPDYNSVTGVSEAARVAYNRQFAKGAEAGTIHNIPGQPFAFASETDQRTRMFFDRGAFTSRANLLEDMVHEFIHDSGQTPVYGMFGLGHDLAGYDWYKFLQDACK